eukprot:1033282-Rhodomonas_salina.2
MVPPVHHVPATQTLHSDPRPPENPSLHTHDTAGSLPSAEDESATHPSTTFPPGQKLSAGHTLHSPPSWP